MVRYFLIFIFLLTVSVNISGQGYDLEKIHPMFRAVIAKELPELGLKFDAPSVDFAGVNIKGEKIYTAIIYTDFPKEIVDNGIHINSIYPGFVTVRITPSEILKISGFRNIKYINVPVKMDLHNDVSASMSGAILLGSGYINNIFYNGSGVITAIIDTGIDWTHLDFRSIADNTKSRILFIWDQTLTKQTGENPPAGFNYGVEYTKVHIDDELDGNPANYVRERDTHGHGTHVAGIICGNGNSLTTKRFKGVAPESDIIIVKTTFTDADIADAYNYLNQKKILLGKSIVVNASLGSNFGPHDGTDVMSIAINSFTGIGKVSVVSAGNSGSDNIHYSNTISPNNFIDVLITVPSYTPTSGTYNDYFLLDTWFDDNTSVNVTVTSPNNINTTQNANGSTTNQTSDGTVYIDNNINAGNNDREINIQIYDAVANSPPRQGVWRFRLVNTSENYVTFHTWLYGYKLGSAILTITNGNSNYTLGNSAENAIIVGSYVTKWRWETNSGSFYAYTGTDRTDNISSFSSIGPTRDGRQKPDISAPGQGLGSSRSVNASFSTSSILPGGYHVIMAGTSMSSPSTAGAVALLLQHNSNFSAAEIKSFINSTANTDAYTGVNLPNYVWGYGKLDIFKVMAMAISQTSDYKRNIVSYDQWGNNSSLSLTSTQKVALRFTAPFSGKVTGALFHTGATIGLTSPIYAEIWSNGSGNLPLNKLGSTSSLEQTKVFKYSWNYINMQNSGVSVISGNEYHLVLYFTSGSNTDLFRENSSLDNRSSLFSGSSWSAYNYDIRMRPEITSDATPLPVTLVLFTSSVNNRDVKLNWVTAFEENNSGFEILRRFAPQNDIQDEWKKVGYVKGSGTKSTQTNYFFEERNLQTGKYQYRLKQIDYNGNFEYFELSSLVEIKVPTKFDLSQNYPNPFNPITKIDYTIPFDGKVSLRIFDILGREIKTIAYENQKAGYYTIEFDGANLASGVYFYKLVLDAGSRNKFSATKKMVILK